MIDGTFARILGHSQMDERLRPLRRFSRETRILARSFTDPILKAQMQEIASSMEMLVDHLANQYTDPRHPVVKARMHAVWNSLEKLADELEQWYPDQRA